LYGLGSCGNDSKPKGSRTRHFFCCKSLAIGVVASLGNYCIIIVFEKAMNVFCRTLSNGVTASCLVKSHLVNCSITLTTGSFLDANFVRQPAKRCHHSKTTKLNAAPVVLTERIDLFFYKLVTVHIGDSITFTLTLRRDIPTGKDGMKIRNICLIKPKRLSNSFEVRVAWSIYNVSANTSSPAQWWSRFNAPLLTGLVTQELQSGTI
jgi:hypothetical protein